MDEDLGFIMVRGDYQGNLNEICDALNKFEWDLDCEKFKVVDGRIKFKSGMVREPSVYPQEWDAGEFCDEYPLEHIKNVIFPTILHGTIEIIVCSSDLKGSVAYQSLRVSVDGCAERSHDIRKMRYKDSISFEVA